MATPSKTQNLPDRKTIAHERLKELVHYEPKTGVFTRLSKVRRHQPGPMAGSQHGDGHLNIFVDGGRYKAHRLAFFYVTGQWPAGELDHVDGDLSNNRWSNLRESPPRAATIAPRLASSDCGRERLAAITAERLRQLFEYHPETGLFRRRHRKGRARADSTPESRDAYGYIRIGIDGERYRAHRLAWLYMTGEWPERDVDHINGAEDDNRWCNLRPAAHAENLWNTKRRTDNISGSKGVWQRPNGRWSVQITAARKRYCLGTFDTIEEARAARESAATRLHGEFARHA